MNTYMIVVHGGVVSDQSRIKAETFRVMNPYASITYVNNTLPINRETILNSFL